MLLKLEGPIDSNGMETVYRNHETREQSQISAFIRLKDLFSKISIHKQEEM